MEMNDTTNSGDDKIYNFHLMGEKEAKFFNSGVF